MKRERQYDFRKKLLKIHDEKICDTNRRAKDDEIILMDDLTIEMMENPHDVVKTATLDFADYLTVSMGLKNISVREGYFCEKNVVKIYMAADVDVDLGDVNGYKGFWIKIDECVEIYAHDERGAAQALYYLEDLMSFRKAPFLEKRDIRKKAVFKTH